MANLIILLLVWCTGMVLCYAWYLALTLRRAFREEVVAEQVGAHAAAEVRPGDVLSYAQPPRRIGLTRRWPAAQAIAGVIVVLMPMSTPLLILLGMGIALAYGLHVYGGVALGAVLLGAGVVAVRGLRRAAGRPAAANWRYPGRALLCWMGVFALTWIVLEVRMQRLLDTALDRADALGAELEIVSSAGYEAEAAYRQAGTVPAKQYIVGDTWTLVTADGRMSPPPPFPEEHQFRIPLLRQAAAMEVSGFTPRASAYSFSTPLPHLAGFRDASWLLKRHAIAEARAGRIGSAIDNINTMHGMAKQAEQGLTMIEILVGMGIHAMAEDTLALVLPLVTDLRDLDRLRLEDSAGKMATLKRAIQGDFGVTAQRSLAQGLRGQVPLFGSPSGLDVALPVYRVALGERDLELWEQCASELPAAVPTDPGAAAGKVTALQSRASAMRWRSLTSSVMMPSLSRAVDKQVEQAAMADLSRAAVAATRFRLQHGRLPGSFEELVEAGLLPAVPVDPFDGKPMRFAMHEGYVFVYTIGIGRADNGGRPYMLGPGGSVVEANPGLILSDRPLWELDLVPLGGQPLPSPATQEAEPQ